MSQIRILLADDHVLTREGLRRFLDAGRDFAVIGETGDGQEAVRLAQELRPDILLLHTSMPGLSGVDVAAALQQTLLQTRIVILAGCGDSEESAPALLGLGARGYLAKTASLADLARALRTVFAGQVYVQAAGIAVLSASVTQETKVKPSPRELDVLRLVARGHGNRDIGKRLFITERTVEFHLKSLFTKLDAASRTEAVYRAYQETWLP